MIICFCPQCGKKAEEEFKFCPGCGLEFPRDEATESEASSVDKHTPQRGIRTPRIYSPRNVSTQNAASYSPSTKVAKSKELPSCSPKSSGHKKQMEKNATSLPKTALKRKLNYTPEKEKDESSPVKPELKTSPWNKKAKTVQVQPLPENDVLTDNNNTKWVLDQLLPSEKTGLHYKVYTLSKGNKEEYSVLKLDVKDGKIYNEQNFFQRAAKKVTVDKWKNLHGCPALGIPTCIGFGVQNSYRFLVFSSLGQNLQTFINKFNDQLSERAVYQILYRMIDVLEYVHENEYVHGDITAENIYVSSDYHEVYLAGYYNAFRFCPAGKHVTYRAGSRTPHEGTVEFISLDVHKGTGPTRRSDLESLGYCMLKWLCGSLPWSDETEPDSIMEHKKRFKTDVPGLLKHCFKRRKIPDVLKLYLQKVMNLDYEEKPNYHEILNNFSSALQKMGVRPYDPVQL
ncbi:serine/threonine-protein kinase VRK3 [Eleutherodactylus coqui]|uniref:serine/threonine-protein kinase VRK3 n=1 Tax=Eleutherodactylus coqui TaxID=57060 RepID=UPI0034622795